jgi:hypothetical protein
MIVDTNPLVICLQNFKKRVSLEVFDDDENPVDATELVLQVQRVGFTGNSGSVVYNDDFIDPPPGGTRIKKTGVGQYNIVWGDPKASQNTPANTETDGRGKFLFVWSVVGPNGTEEEQVTQSLEIVTAHMMDRIREFQDQLDKARMQVSVDPKDFCPLGYTEGWLLQYLRGGMTLINSYQPYPTWLSVEDFSDTFLQTLFDAALVVAVNAQTLFAIASDVEQWSDQGNAFVINHQPKLAAFSQTLAQRLDKIIPQMKLHFVRSGSVKIEAGSNFRINQLVQMAPEGALFRNVFLATPQ